ncbi:hypothetical protein [Micromonospora sp. WMMD737]|uniref:hypothetical protein n=1 Tax=Micromonospora sp. WMMD737 TaxID=3404113 RepID=UPI003B949024
MRCRRPVAWVSERALREADRVSRRRRRRNGDHCTGPTDPPRPSGAPAARRGPVHRLRGLAARGRGSLGFSFGYSTVVDRGKSAACRTSRRSPGSCAP